jgi:hypothetical protein
MRSLFQCKMSLNKGLVSNHRMSLRVADMLRIEDQRAAGRETEPGTDPGIFASQ